MTDDDWIFLGVWFTFCFTIIGTTIGAYYGMEQTKYDRRNHHEYVPISSFMVPFRGTYQD